MLCCTSFCSIFWLRLKFSEADICRSHLQSTHEQRALYISKSVDNTIRSQTRPTPWLKKGCRVAPFVPSRRRRPSLAYSNQPSQSAWTKRGGSKERPAVPRLEVCRVSSKKAGIVKPRAAGRCQGARRGARLVRASRLVAGNIRPVAGTRRERLSRQTGPAARDPRQQVPALPERPERHHYRSID